MRNIANLHIYQLRNDRPLRTMFALLRHCARRLATAAGFNGESPPQVWTLGFRETGKIG